MPIVNFNAVNLSEAVAEWESKVHYISRLCTFLKHLLLIHVHNPGLDAHNTDSRVEVSACYLCSLLSISA